MWRPRNHLGKRVEIGKKKNLDEFVAEKRRKEGKWKVDPPEIVSRKRPATRPMSAKKELKKEEGLHEGGYDSVRFGHIGGGQGGAGLSWGGGEKRAIEIFGDMGVRITTRL